MSYDVSEKSKPWPSKKPVDYYGNSLTPGDLIYAQNSLKDIGLILSISTKDHQFPNGFRSYIANVYWTGYCNNIHHPYLTKCFCHGYVKVKD